MSHVDEGMLHAYLDGELPSAERAALEAHLAQCATCRASLAEERALLERASALLGSAQPPARAVPPFEQLRRAPRRSPWHVRRSFAWAASIALALGAGYLLRSPATGPDQVEGLLYVAENRTVQTPALEQAKAVPAAPAARAQATGRGKSRNLTRPAAEVVRANDKSDTLVAALAVRDQSQRQAGPPTANAAAPLPAPPGPAPAPASGARDSAARAEAPVLRFDEVVVTGSVARRAAEVAKPEERAATDISKWPVISRGTARSLLGDEPVGLPDLTTRTIRRSPGADGVVVVDQELDAGTVIQIFQRAARASSRFDSLVYGGYGRGFERERDDRLARFVGKLRVEISGPLSVDSLNRLLEQVRPLP
ncbi:MAG TPA: zf-HC2 domain-containing protein [Gemmatimonadales bacterium]|nr:zf-HC2 domain-containing protein [Gemmatimonadales bacterium]